MTSIEFVASIAAGGPIFRPSQCEGCDACAQHVTARFMRVRAATQQHGQRVHSSDSQLATTNFTASRSMGAAGSKSDPTKAEIDASAIADALAALELAARMAHLMHWTRAPRSGAPARGGDVP